MAGAEPEPGTVGDSGSTLTGRGHGAVRLAPLDPEQLRRVLEQVTRTQPPPSVLPDAARRLREGAQQVAQQRGSGAAGPRLLTPQVRRRAVWRGRSWPEPGVRSPGRPRPAPWGPRSDVLGAPGPPRDILRARPSLQLLVSLQYLWSTRSMPGSPLRPRVSFSVQRMA